MGRMVYIPSEGDCLTVAGNVYTVTEVRPDGVQVTTPNTRHAAIGGKPVYTYDYPWSSWFDLKWDQIAPLAGFSL